VQLLQVLKVCLPFVCGTIVGVALPLWAVVNVSAFAPNVWMWSVDPGEIVGGIVALGARADGPGVAAIQFRVGGRDVGPEITSGPCLVNWDTRNEADGTHTLSIEARDSGGNAIWTTPVVVTVSNTRQLDVTQPSIWLTNPTVGAVLTGSVSFRATASDPSGVAGVWFVIDDRSIGPEDTSAPYEVSVSTATLSNGAHYVQAAARDNAFNVAISPPQLVTVSNGSAGGCLIPDPFVFYGGGVCVNGGWIMSVGSSWSAPASSSAAWVGGCTMPDPFVSMGGGTCVQGGWLPPGMTLPRALPTETRAPATSSGSRSTATGGCATPDPFAVLGGGTCVRGGWLPPGMVISR
jgi:hypothetical protein